MSSTTTPATPAATSTATAAIIEPSSRIESVKLEGLALLRIAKHCHESLPQMVTGSLLGLVVDDNVLEITHAFAVPDEQQQDNNNNNNNDGDFQVEMMGLLREVNVDHNCVGWYQSMYLGSYSTTSFLENQFSYQTDLSEHAVVVLYDPMQTTHGNLVLRCFRLSSSAMNVYKQSQQQQQHQQPSGPSSPTNNNNNSSSSTTTTPPLQDPKSIFEELPVTLTQPGLVKAFLMDQKVNNTTTTTRPTTLTTPTDFSRLDLSTNPYLEKHLEFLCSWVDDLVHEQHKFQSYARNRNRASRNNNNNNNNNNATDQDATTTTTTTAREPSRMESLLLMNQIHSYCQQVDKFAGGGFGKLYLAGALHKKE